MEPLFNKLFLILRLNNLNKNFEKIVKKANQNYNVIEINNNFIQTLNISVEYNASDVNEDKQRQCYKQLKCFWPKCRYSCYYENVLTKHISHHLNKRQIVCEECNKHFNSNSDLLQHKRYVHSTDRTVLFAIKLIAIKHSKLKEI